MKVTSLIVQSIVIFHLINLGTAFTFPAKRKKVYRSFHYDEHEVTFREHRLPDLHNFHPRSLTTLNASFLDLPIPIPLIAKESLWGNIAVLSATASVSHQIGQKTFIGRLLGPPVTAMAIAFILGSIGVLNPGGSPGAKVVQLLSIQLATPLLLLGVNIRECRQRCGPLLAAFILAAISTIIACLTAFPFCANSLQKALGVDGLKIAAALMAKNIGGGLNYVAVCQSLNASPNAVAAGLCVDNIFALIYFPLTSALAAGRPDISDDIKTQSDRSPDVLVEGKAKEIESHNPINPETISAALTVGALATWLGETLGGQAGALPISTTLTILFTVICPRISKCISLSGEILGTSLLYLFFATAGAPGLSIADSVRSAFLPLGVFLSLLYGVHGAILFLVRSIVLLTRGKKGGENADDEGAVLPQRLLVASSAAIGGPATACALAKANNWNSLVAPSLIVGNLGYAVATFAGIAFHTYFSKGIP